jgi:hypothetical protein
VDFKTLDPIDAASLIKLYFAEMQNPLFTSKLTEEWKATKRTYIFCLSFHSFDFLLFVSI